MAIDPARPPWLVGIRPAGAPAPEGCGTLVTDRLVLTCAHVVDPANPAEPPTGPLHVHFPFLAEHEQIPAWVVPGGWHPRQGWAGDVALLELSRPAPPGAGPAPLCRTDADLFDHTFRCYGFPKGHESGGVSIRGDIVGYSEIDWLQLESTTPTGWTTEPGFSGAPVWDNTLRGVVGMVAARQKPDRTDRRVGFAKSLDSIGRLWPALGPLVHDITEQEQREQLRTLLALPLTAAGELPRLDQLDPHDLGVSESKYTAAGHEPYVARPSADRELDEALAAGGFVLVTGGSKAGKSRTLHERLSRGHGEARVVVPRRHRGALEALVRVGLPQTSGPGEEVVIWLDDLHHYLLSGALDAGVLDLLLRHDPPCLLVATLTHRHREELRTLDNEVGRAAGAVLRRATVVTLPRTLVEEERREAALLYPREDFSQRGIGEMLVAAPALESRFDAGTEQCPEGWLVVRAAADWARMGALALLDEPTLRELFDEYRRWAAELDVEPGEAAFHAGVDWARDRAPAGIALLGRTADESGRPGHDFARPGHESGRAGHESGRAGYAVFPYIAEYLDAVGGPATEIPDFAWARAARTLSDADLLTLAYVAGARDKEDVATALLTRLVEQGQEEDVRATAALLLALVRIYRREFAEAEALLRQAAAAGPENVAELAKAELADLLAARGDYPAARELLEAAISARDPHVALIAQAGLAGVQWQLGEVEQAERLLAAVLAYGVSEVGPRATERLGRVLAGQGGAPVIAPLGLGGPEHGKQAMAPRSTGGGEPADQPWLLSEVVGAAASSSIAAIARTRVVGLLVGQGELDRAEELLRSVIEDGDPLARPVAQASLGELMIVRGRHQAAADLLEQAVSAATPVAVDGPRLYLGVARLHLDQVDEGLALVQQVAGAGHPEKAPEATALLGFWFANAGRHEEAEHWLRLSMAGDHSRWARTGQVGLACLLAGRGEQEEALRLLAEVAASGRVDPGPWAAHLKGNLALALGRQDEAVQAYRTAVAYGHREWSLAARINLALVLAEQEPAQDASPGAGSARCAASPPRGGAEEAAALLAEVARAPHAELAPRAADLLGDLLVREGRPEEAEAAYRMAIGYGHPEWALAARIDLAMLLVNLERSDESEVLLHELIASGHPVAAGTATALLGVLLLYTDRWEEGRAHLRTAVDTARGPALQLARFHLAKLLIERDEPQPAAELLRAVVEDEPSEATEAARATLALLLVRGGKADEAAELLGGGAGSANPQDKVAAFAEAGEHLFDAGELHAAAELLQAAREIPEVARAPRVAALLGVARRALNQFPEARELLTEALDSEEEPLEPMVRRYLGSTLFRLGESAQAEQVLLPLARAELDGGHRPGALLLLAQVLDTIPGRQGEAGNWFEAASHCGDPEIERRASLDHALQLQRLGHPERAREILATLSGEDTDRADGTDHDDSATPGDSADRGGDLLDTAEPTPATGLPTAVLLLLADLADAEADPAEAAYWRTCAEAAGSAGR
ncbi:tetratricopeptide repeat protein [Kitasatospora sp. NBC_01287]|uniref:tetratricopeptide repeat protein n=1 Tax=Kitasatospora sp. NBC_01287 TaxID=2903573 RepID=UPI0022578298|nr:tetratricopeptide repeat protein [Kitasatospora sp. NBC_01287]MCX4750113.1 tetratricopeptide repeat protein [Kitasatospora sp. NBC_01287]